MVANTEPFNENLCKKCGTHIGFGHIMFHIPYCEECDPDTQEESSDAPSRTDGSGSPDATGDGQ
jgi:hypothetical protein